jgi:hypothetical protein
MATTAPEPLTGGILIPREQQDVHFHLTNLRLLAKVLDSAVAIPGTKFRVGLDPIIGLIPWVGDAVGAVIGTYILVTAAKLGVPKTVLMRMLLNIGADAAVGAVPFAGDVLDAAWRANSKNIALLERAVAEPKATRRASTLTLIGLGVVVVAMVGGGIALSVWLVRLIWLQFA